jgi:hypothetical protein
MLSFGNNGRCELSTLLLSRWTGLSLPLVLTVVISGCGGAAPQKAANVDDASSAKPAAKGERLAAADHGEKVAPKKKKEGGIPMDAFFDNPLEVASNNAVVAGPPNTVKEPAGPVEKPKSDGPKTADAGGAASWSELLPVEELQSEVKRVQNRLKASMQSQGTYNGNYKEITVDGAVIAAMAGIAIEHSGDVSWKANAPLIRDIGFELSQASAGLGKDNYEKSKAAYEKLESVFNGNIPPDAPKSAPKRPFNETADRTGLMKRIEKATFHLRDNINTEAKLKAGSEDVQHETLMISTLGKIVTTEGYSSADEADYQQFAQALINGAKEANSAAKDTSFDKFSQSMDKVNKSCAQCHANYGNG